uniref:Cytoplasmic polyadenylation element-binding protein ZZ domain-containing protein n=1 Tax=Ditylenchus dipsaci TaxID=166011 RepID=A0A915E3J6_9BILA
MKCRCGAIPSDPLTAEEVSRKVFVGGVPAGTIRKAAFHLKVTYLPSTRRRNHDGVSNQISETRFAPVEVKAWNVSNAVYMVIMVGADFVLFPSSLVGLPRTCTAEFLAKAIEEVIGPVAYCTIEQDKFTRYRRVPLKCARNSLEFSGSARKVELKPFLAPNMPCCGCGVKTNTKFCKALICLAYYCEGCWKEKHSTIGGMVAHEASKKMHSKKIVV